MIERVLNAPIALLFLIIGMSYLLGKQKMCGFELGSVSGVLLTGSRSLARLQAARHPSIVKGEARSPMPTIGLQEVLMRLPMCC